MGDDNNAQSLPGVVVIIAGPTATGKTDLSLELARVLGGEIVNTDSMQLYRGMDIGTAKLPVSQRRGIGHHVFDIWDVSETANVAAYQQLARSAVDDMLAQGTVPILVGGSGLYIQSVVEEMAFPGTDPKVRSALEQELADVGPAVLHARLAQHDPKAAAAILPSNGRRIVRALEVVSLHGSFTASLPVPKPVYRTVALAVDRDTTDLDRRIEERVDVMWQTGLVDEVTRLCEQGLAEGVTASRALGYRQVLDFLAGDMTEEESRMKTVTGTRRFVRRQRSWFRRHDRYTWLDGASPTLFDEAMAVIGDRKPSLIP